MHDRLVASVDGTGPQSACLHFAYTLLEVFIFGAYDRWSDRLLRHPCSRKWKPQPISPQPLTTTYFIP
ncbi:uncharacterized protein BDW43DRAFT_43980 [Aspergillus alliaceus]|uniref:uncharacterized protein n=1 Tax=Petromyces alliaceus TaxID=209559 RepID=UPI0012A5F9CE|nr:uncharacterized protein BDW43DRAFT_43980 [Aspergillus alliaceus]KAB8235298.1 hypothetical protein BDW43DRAFT_43980 [Aspergillus alliaceus]